MPLTMDTRLQSRLVVAAALLVTLAAAAYMAVNVAGNYHGNITGLFYTGPLTPLPSNLATSHTFRVKDEKGYDAQYYHVIAHDPLNLQGSLQYVDNPRVRWRRIAIPGLAALFPNPDWGYVIVELVFTFLGALWLGPWALAFLLIPAALVSLDRLTVDLALASLTIGFIDFRRPWPILLFAPLVRETGLILIAGWCLWNALHNKWRDVLLGALCAIPTLLWYLYVQFHTPPDGVSWLTPYPFSGLIARTLAGDSGPVTTLWLRAAHYSEDLALAGIWLAVGCALWLLIKRSKGLIEITAILFVLAFAVIGRYDVWDTAYAAGRTMSPLLILLGLIAVRDRRWLFAAPLFLILPRIALQYEAQLLAAFRNLT
jgi:hypothetical protein